jgi:flagellar biosynthesis protein FliQ
MFLVLLVAGVGLGVFQAATQINDPALGALPRLVVAIGLVWMMGGWIMERLAGFLVSALQRMAVKPF